MKLIVFLAISCLALHSGKGAPISAVYKFVRCNPEGDLANCVTQQSPEMAWSPDLPAKLPASTAQYLEAEPTEDERPVREEEEYEDDGAQMISEEGESPLIYLSEDGSGGYEGSAADAMADQPFLTLNSEIGSGESWTNRDMEPNKGEDKMGLRRLFPSRFLAGEAKPAEQDLREDHLLQL